MPEHASPHAGLGLRVAIASASADAAVAAQLAAMLRESGAELVDVGDSPRPDGVIVLLSEAATADPEWIPQEEGMTRLIPVRVGPLEEDRVPDSLRRLNWIEWAPQRPAVTLGFVVAGLLSDPNRHQVSQQLAHEAAAWDRAGRPDDQLIADRRRARRMLALLTELAADPIAAPGEVTAAFVAASDRATRRAQRRRRLGRGAVVVAVVLGIGVVGTALGRIQANARISRAAIVTAGEEVVINQMPEWSAANAADLLLEGTDAQRQLGRSTLLAAMTRSWEISDAAFIDSVLTAAPYDHGRRAVVLAVAPPHGSGLAILDVPRGRTLVHESLPSRFEALDVAPTGRLAAVAGHGAAIVHLRSGRVRSLTTAGRYAGVRLVGRQVALWTEGGRLELRDLVGGGVSVVGQYDSVLDVSPEPSGGSALVAYRPGHYAIVALASGRVLARANLAPGQGIGALSPDGRRAVVDGGDGQLWTLTGGGASPTGVPVPVELTDLAWASGRRLVVASDSERGQVFLMPGAERLGKVCALAPSLSDVDVEPGGDTIACGGDARSFWTLPQVPLSAPPATASGQPRAAASPYARIQIRGRSERIAIRSAGVFRAGAWKEPFDSKITAAVFSPTSHQVALADERGEVEVVGLTAAGVEQLLSWQAPDRSPIVALRWHEELEADTASGQRWRVPSCPHCETDAGLIAAARARFSGCFSARQMEWLDSTVRARLGLRECEPLFVIGRG